MGTANGGEVEILYDHIYGPKPLTLPLIAPVPHRMCSIHLIVIQPSKHVLVTHNRRSKAIGFSAILPVLAHGPTLGKIQQPTKLLFPMHPRGHRRQKSTSTENKMGLCISHPTRSEKSPEPVLDGLFFSFIVVWSLYISS